MFGLLLFCSHHYSFSESYFIMQTHHITSQVDMLQCNEIEQSWWIGCNLLAWLLDFLAFVVSTESTLKFDLLVYRLKCTFSELFQVYWLSCLCNRFGFSIPRISASSFEISEVDMTNSAKTIVHMWNRGAHVIKALAQGEDWNLFFQVCNGNDMHSTAACVIAFSMNTQPPDAYTFALY